jgi:hypothetical protein
VREKWRNAVYRREKVTGWIFLMFVLLLLLGAWLSRWRFVGTQTRVNRFTGYTEKRVEKAGGGFEWVPAGTAGSER